MLWVYVQFITNIDQILWSLILRLSLIEVERPMMNCFRPISRRFPGHGHFRSSTYRPLVSLSDAASPALSLAFSSTSQQLQSPVSLAFERFQPASTTGGSLHQPLIVLHGLFGSKQNWRGIAKKLSQATSREVYTLDLRNHGQSPSTPGATSYLDYASDIQYFIQSNQLKNVVLMGHSMGGKVAMAFALQNPQSSMISKLIVIDISPAKGPISDNFKTYLEAMKEINSSPVTTRKQADEILSKYEQDIGVRQFLLTNLVRLPLDSIGETYQIRLPLEVLDEQISTDGIGDFPFDPPIASASNSSQGPRYKKSSLFIKGAHSKYINRHNMPVIEAFFTNHQLVTLDTGHWVHAEKPKEFIETITQFMKS
ncbi:hypothetical protein O181_080986 [Austropuccinia psidii MF-1]|uniref:AB hydrolase-1 domain-containing protein n=1 Tax=Austropuccinia psidii MF-1 TaxID=1389203 RepID=A0A9Q3IFG9_9BASI|nr:hypothetical protein [Austropuccinia psidii MF-1]